MRKTGELPWRGRRGEKLEWKGKLNLSPAPKGVLRATHIFYRMSSPTVHSQLGPVRLSRLFLPHGFTPKEHLNSSKPSNAPEVWFIPFKKAKHHEHGVVVSHKKTHDVVRCFLFCLKAQQRRNKTNRKKRQNNKKQKPKNKNTDNLACCFLVCLKAQQGKKERGTSGNPVEASHP